LEADIGTLDDDMSNLSVQGKGYEVLNDDIMALVEQVRPQYSKGKEIDDHNVQVELIRKKLRSEKEKETYPGPLQLLARGLPFTNTNSSKKSARK